ncbi:MAG TPA: ABC transporter ATP-binding protein [Erysipelothrix sp.]
MKKSDFIKKYVQGKEKHFVGMFIATILFVTIVLINPLLLSFTIDNVVMGKALDTPFKQFLARSLGGIEYIKSHLWIIALVMVIFTMIRGAILLMRDYLAGTIGETATEKLRNELYDHIQHLPYSYHVQAKTGDMIQRVTSDVEQINNFLNHQIRDLIYAILMTVVSLVILLQINVKLTLISMITFPFILIFAFVFFKKMQDNFRAADEAEAAMSNVFQESLDGVRVVKAFNREAYELEKFTEKNQDHRDKTKHMLKLMGMYWGFSDFISFLQLFIVLFASMLMVRNGIISMGDAIVFISYIGMVLWPLRSIGRILSDMGKVSVAIERLNEILEVEQEDLEVGVRPQLKGKITFEQVSFAYADDIDTRILKDVSFIINPGTTVAIMGPTGSGKSTMAHLLTRLYDPTSGMIYIDETPITDISRDYLRSQVGIVLQEPFLFSKSIYENIRISQPDASEQQVYHAANIASIHNAITGFDLGYQTPVGEKGVTLSGGQKQRIAIARTVIKNQAIIIFDDSLSALDAQTDKQIREALKETRKEATKLIITHRINTAAQADMIIVLDQGRVVQMGTHEELLKAQGIYRDIAKIQDERIESGDFNG